MSDALLRECRLALDSLLKQRPGMASLVCGSTTLGNLRAELNAYRGEYIYPKCCIRQDTENPVAVEF